MIPLSRPDVGADEIAAVTAVLKTPYLSLGPQLRAFEESLETVCQSPHVIATSSGTAGLHLCLRALDLKPGDEVITTPFSFIASANVLLFENLAPVFVDIDPNTLNLDPLRIEAAMTPKTKAILVVHAFGNPADMVAINAIARKYGLAVIEDACEALGSYIQGQHVGTFGDLGTLAFYPNKQMTTGEGGAVLTGNPIFNERIRCLRNQGRRPSGAWLDMEELGYNYRLSDIQCALGCAQLERLEYILDARRQVAGWYDEVLGEEGNFILPPRTENPGNMGWFVYVVRLASTFNQAHRDRIFHAMATRQIACGRYFAPIHLQPYYRKHFGFKPGDFPLTEAAGFNALALPFYNQLTQAQVRQVCEALIEEVAALDS